MVLNGFSGREYSQVEEYACRPKKNQFPLAKMSISKNRSKFLDNYNQAPAQLLSKRIACVKPNKCERINFRSEHNIATFACAPENCAVNAFDVTEKIGFITINHHKHAQNAHFVCIYYCKHLSAIKIEKSNLK